MPKSPFSLMLMVVAVGAFAPDGALAQSRYATPPPLTLSPDLTAPWQLQLKPGAVRQLKRNVRRSALEGRRAVREAAYTVPTPPPRPDAQLKGSIVRPFDRSLLPTVVSYETDHPVGTVVVDTEQRRLFLVQTGGMALRYGIGVGKPGFEWAGSHKVTRKAKWPTWTPPKEMIRREAAKGRILPNFMPGGPDNPMGARALYLGSTIYRIHGTNQDWSIGLAVSSGCIRMRNEDVMDLYTRVPVGARVHVI